MNDAALAASFVAAVPLVLLMLFVWCLGRVWG
jgi:hypothetical protein